MERLAPEQVFEAAFCMGDCHGLESAARICSNFFQIDNPNLSQEQMVQYLAVGKYFAELLHSCTLKPTNKEKNPHE